MTFVVGVTGGIGSGKSAVTDHLASLGITVVDADLASRLIVEPGRPALQAIADHFGTEILLRDGRLDRAALRGRVFSDPAERLWLEQLTHPLIGEEIERQLWASQSPYTVLSSPLLLETSQKQLCQWLVVVDVPESLQLSRTMARDDNAEDQVRRIMAAQLPRTERLSAADHIIDNSGTIEELHGAVAALHENLLSRL
jgi:dephospho-CoA kinase